MANARTSHLLVLGALVMLGLLPAAPAFAANPPAAPLPAWEQLSPAQREQLIAPVRQRWNAEPAQRQHMLERARRWQQMTPDQRQHARHGMRRWEHLDPAQREQMRALFENMRGLPPEQRATLKQRWKRMTPEQRRAWVQEHPPKAPTLSPQSP